MNLHEYQAKSILKKFSVPVPEGIVATTPEKAVENAETLKMMTHTEKWAVKAQVHAGGRGKGGGIKIASSIDEVKQHAKNILGMNLVTPQTGAKGKPVSKVLIELGIYYPGDSPIQEFYVSILLDRKTSHNIIMYSTEGGMEIEEVAHKTPHLIFTEEIDPVAGFRPFQARKVAFDLGLSGKAFNNMVQFITALYNAYTSIDADLMEINPVIKTSDDLIYAADAKVRIDGNALFRHPEYAAMNDITQIDAHEVEAAKFHLNYIKLDGNVGCMVNGAGLAMATMDIIKLAGGDPANFLDVGGSAKSERVEQAFRLIMSDENVKAILVNIFGGIVRCDRVAQGIVDACKNIGELKIPIIVRLQGTNAEEAKKIIEASGLQVRSAILLQEAADMVTKALAEK